VNEMLNDFPEKPYEVLAKLLAEKAEEYEKELQVVGPVEVKEKKAGFGGGSKKAAKQEVGKLDSDELFPTLGGK
jgi:hypothetical protein